MIESIKLSFGDKGIIELTLEEVKKLKSELDDIFKDKCYPIYVETIKWPPLTTPSYPQYPTWPNNPIITYGVKTDSTTNPNS